MAIPTWSVLVLLTVGACELPTVATVVDPMGKLCKAHPEDERCVDLIRDYCAIHADDKEWCMVDGAVSDASRGEMEGGITMDGAIDASCPGCPTDDAGHDASCTNCPVLECTKMSDCAGKAGGDYCSAKNECVACLESPDCSVSDPVCAGNACTGCTKKADCSARSSTPVCDAPSGDCVECTASDATKCTAASKVCKTGATACVQCNENADCKSAGASRCDGNTCNPCENDGDCAGIMNGATALDACVSGQCVDCRIDAVDTKVDYGCAGSTACDPTSHACTGKPKNTIDICLTCVADSECIEGHRCVPMFFNSQSLGGYCMKAAQAGCAFPYGAAAINRASVSGALAVDYCGITEGLTSCEAIKGLEDGAGCAGGQSSECGGEGALCRTVNNVANLCTYACNSSATCPVDFPCKGLSGAKYCGGPN